MLERAVEHVGHGLEAAVGMPVGAPGLARAVVDGAHLIHVDEGVEGLDRRAGEGPADGEALALEPRRSRGDAGHRSLDGPGRRLGEAGQGQGVSGHGRHGVTLLKYLRVQLYALATRSGP